MVRDYWEWSRLGRLTTSITKAHHSSSDVGFFNITYLHNQACDAVILKKAPHFVWSFLFFDCCDSVGIRTPNLRIRSAMLYPVELQSHFCLNGVQRYSGSLIDQFNSEEFEANKKSAPVSSSWSNLHSCAITDADPPGPLTWNGLGAPPHLPGVSWVDVLPRSNDLFHQNDWSPPESCPCV